MAIIKAISGKNKGSIARIIHYIMKKEKTDYRLITGINCEGSTNCIQQMKMTKAMYKKEGGRQYKHYVLSFHPDDFQNEYGDLLPDAADQAYEITLKFLNDPRIFESLQGYEIAVATHVDRDHIHSHIVINSVNMETGTKYRQSYKDLQIMKKVVQDLEAEYGLHKSIKRKRRQRGDIVVNNQKGYQAIRRNIESIKENENKYKSWILDIYQKIIQVIKSNPKTKDDYIKKLRLEDVIVQWSDNRKYITYMDNNNHKIRDKKLSDMFDMELNKEVLMNEFERNRRCELESSDRRISKEVSNIVRQASTDATRQIRHREKIAARIEEQRNKFVEITSGYSESKDHEQEL